MNFPLLRCRDLHCRRPLWRAGASTVRGIDADFSEASFHAICGPDGCGKNLLLHLLGLLEQPDSGEVWLGETNATSLSTSERDLLRLRNFGFLFHAAGLLPSLSVLENIAFPVIKAALGDEGEQAERTLHALQFCGLESEAERPTAELTTAQRAAVTFARAIAHRPPLVIAESPGAEEILVPLARRAVSEIGLTVIWGTQADTSAARAADRVVTMAHGQFAVHAA